jgi:hypothetical protein
MEKGRRQEQKEIGRKKERGERKGQGNKLNKHNVRREKRND